MLRGVREFMNDLRIPKIRAMLPWPDTAAGAQADACRPRLSFVKLAAKSTTPHKGFVRAVAGCLQDAAHAHRLFHANVDITDLACVASEAATWRVRRPEI